MTMSELIEALEIFKKYKDVVFPTHCEHDVMYIMAVTKEEVSEEDTKKLDELSFFFSDGDDCWISFGYGSA